MRDLHFVDFYNNITSYYHNVGFRQEDIHTSVANVLIFFFYLGFLLRTFTNHRTAEEGGGHFFNSSLPLPPASQALRH